MGHGNHVTRTSAYLEHSGFHSRRTRAQRDVMAVQKMRGFWNLFFGDVPSDQWCDGGKAS